MGSSSKNRQNCLTSVSLLVVADGEVRLAIPWSTLPLDIASPKGPEHAAVNRPVSLFLLLLPAVGDKFRDKL